MYYIDGKGHKLVCNSMPLGGDEIWGKHHSVVLELQKISQGKAERNFPFTNTTRVVFIPNFTAIPMLLQVPATFANFCWCFHVHNYISEGLIPHINGVGPSFLENTAVSHIITFLRMLHTW